MEHNETVHPMQTDKNVRTYINPDSHHIPFREFYRDFKDEHEKGIKKEYAFEYKGFRWPVPERDWRFEEKLIKEVDDLMNSICGICRKIRCASYGMTPRSFDLLFTEKEREVYDLWMAPICLEEDESTTEIIKKDENIRRCFHLTVKKNIGHLKPDERRFLKQHKDDLLTIDEMKRLNEHIGKRHDEESSRLREYIEKVSGEINPEFGRSGFVSDMIHLSIMNSQRMIHAASPHSEKVSRWFFVNQFGSLYLMHRLSIFYNGQQESRNS